MSSRFAVITTVVLSAVLSGSMFYGYKIRGDRPLRALSSELNSPVIVEGGSFSQSSLRPSQKVTGPLRVSLEVEGQAPVREGDIFTLRGTLLSDENLSHVRLMWVVPSEQVRILKGQERQEEISLRQGQPYAVDMQLQILSATGGIRLYLKSSVFSGGSQFGASAVYVIKENQKAGEETVSPSNLKSGVMESQTLKKDEPAQKSPPQNIRIFE